MSGATIGGVVGAFVGFWIGGPAGAQVGWMAGSAIGGYVDPTQIQGPRLADTRGQTSQVGGAIPRAWGTAPVPGNIIWQQENPPVTEHKHTDDGKGSGTEQVTYTYTRSYAVMYHLGEISGVMQVKRNAKIVYDAREDAVLLALYESSGMTEAQAEKRLAEQRAENVKWLDKCTFYNGTQTQNPDPTIEAYLGANNVPAYRGRAYFVVTDDETQAGEIAQFEIVVSHGVVTPATIDGGLAAGVVADIVNDDFPLAGAEGDYEYIGYMGMADASATQTYSAGTVQEIIDYFTDFDYSPYLGGTRAPSIYMGYSAGPYPGTGTIPGQGLDIQHHGINAAVAQPDVTDNFGVTLVYNDFEADSWLTTVAFSGQCGIGAATVGNKAGAVAKIFASDPGGQYQLFENCGGNNLYGLYPLCIRATRKRIAPPGGAPEGGVALPDAPGFYYVPGVGVVSAISYESVTGNFKVLAPARHAPPVGGDRDVYTNYEQGPVLESTDPLYSNEAYWTAAYNAAVTAGDMPAGFTYSSSGTSGGDTYPVVETQVWQSESLEYDTIEPDGVTLGEIVADACDLSGLTSDEYDVSQLTDTLDGFVIARETDAAGVVESLRPIGMFDPAEWDGKLRFIKRGGTSVAAINSDDLVAKDGDAIERELVQEVELLRKVTVGYLDADASWAPNTQIWERRVGTIDARGESVNEVTAVIGADKAATAAKRKGLTAWGEPEKQKLCLPYRLAALTPTDPVSYTDASGNVEQIRLMQVEDDSGVRYIESATNCAEAYSATATGVAPKPPAISEPSLRGPTEAVYMNLPSLRSQDNVPGVTIAACGVLPGWTGASIMLSADGGVSYQQVTQFTQPTDMGVLTASCTASGEPISVRMTSGALASITDAQIALRQNAFAITTSEVSELGQFKTATATGSDAYNLTNNIRGQLGTTAASHASGDPFVMVATAQFVPLDISLAGKTLYFKAVTFGTSQDAAEAVPFVFNPLFTSVIISTITVDGEEVTVSGQPIYVVQ